MKECCGNCRRGETLDCDTPDGTMYYVECHYDPMLRDNNGKCWWGRSEKCSYFEARQQILSSGRRAGRASIMAQRVIKDPLRIILCGSEKQKKCG